MTIDEAISYLHDDIEGITISPPIKLDEAEKLGIEALKLIKQTRQNAQKPAYTRLPDETEE